MTTPSSDQAPEDEWEGRVGRMTLLVNAQDPHAAMACAVQAAFNRHFSTLMVLGPHDALPS
jgi:hypothetical protein